MLHEDGQILAFTVSVHWNEIRLAYDEPHTKSMNAGLAFLAPWFSFEKATIGIPHTLPLNALTAPSYAGLTKGCRVACEYMYDDDVYSCNVVM